MTEPKKFEVLFIFGSGFRLRTTMVNLKRQITLGKQSFAYHFAVLEGDEITLIVFREIKPTE